jgi:hypothetical protein
VRGGFDEQEVFAGRFEFALPGVNRFDRRGVDVDTSGEAFLDDDPRDLTGLEHRATGDEDEPELRGTRHGVWIVAEQDEQKANALKKLTVDASTPIRRKVVSADRADGAEFVYEDGSWMQLKLSGTEPLLRLSVETESEAATKNVVRDASEWILRVG